MKFDSATIGNGQVQWLTKIEGTPESRKTTDNVTIVNSAIPEIPGHFSVSYSVRYSFENAGLTVNNFLNVEVLLLEFNPSAAYMEVEIMAAKKIPGMLRDIADGIENEIRAAEERERT